MSKFTNPIPPPAPTIAGVTPAGPANQNDIGVRGSAFRGTTVRIYAGAGCGGAPVADPGHPAEFGSGVAVHVADDTTTVFSATATINGQTSPCSSTVTYVEDSTPPATPAIASTSPAGPANDPSPRVLGNAEAGSTIFVYTSADCSGIAGATGSAADFASPGFVVGVRPGANSLHTVAIDAAGNASACSAGFPYEYTGAFVIPTGAGAPAPDTFITGGPDGGSWLRVPTFTFRSDRAGAKFQCRVDAGAWSACDSGSYTTLPLDVGAHHFEVAAIGAGNVVDPTPARRDFAINDKKTDVQTCGFDPLLAAGTRKLVEPYICDISSDDEVGFSHEWGVCGTPGGAICTTIPDWVCPLGARCTLKTVAAFAHDDTNVFWTMGTQRDTSPYVDIKFGRLRPRIHTEALPGVGVGDVLGTADAAGLRLLGGREEAADRRRSAAARQRPIRR